MRSNRNISEIIKSIDWCIRNKKQPWIMMVVGFLSGIIVFIIGLSIFFKNQNKIPNTTIMVMMDKNADGQTYQLIESRLFLIAFLIVLGFGIFGFFMYTKQRSTYLDIATATNLFFKKNQCFFRITKYQKKQLIIAKTLLLEIQERKAKEDVREISTNT
ncbi:hypothetical protein [Mycoplasma bradburyae]|uniref:Transmembrane protein n=1 Tax=Mycoplasma bradburyae TaxID=2963128 RepID=A0AAW6HQW8_9MOLU|nr:hypothetical protein [Mycoplasma bradburyae]MDC4183395.1 hypothetical protein [Mycoplasma bradburyae]MDC4184206.1 hypothetical protein [Mycoplasma bradburyae]UTS71168.1 hypothetical protein NMG77_01755 [Mycoplasma bradburyae]